MNKKNPFYGREEELKTLLRYKDKKTASLIILRGRRRVGKSRLIQEYAKHFDNVYSFTGISPTPETTAATQKQEFIKQLGRTMGVPSIPSDDWGDIFWLMSNQVKDQPALIILDEITWMGDKDPHFLSKFHHIWDNYLKNNPNLILIICGSVSYWIEENLLNSTAFVGRISFDMQLRELPLDTCLKFWKSNHSDTAYQVSNYEIFKVLSVTGGIPWYLEQINPKLCADDNIRDLAFAEGAVLYRDFDRIFTDVFGKKNELYIKIVTLLAKGPATYQNIIEHLKVNKSGNYTEHMNNLISAGFITRDFTWTITTGKEGKLSKYRLSDNYTRFYLKYITPNKSKIINGSFASMSLSSLSNWNTILGLQFENLVLNNRHLIRQALNINISDLLFDGPYFQRTTQRQKACQVDYLIQTNNTLYICEIKFSKNKITPDIIPEVQEKSTRLKIPKHYNIRPVLIHVNGVSGTLSSSDYFAKIIDFTNFMQDQIKT